MINLIGAQLVWLLCLGLTGLGVDCSMVQWATKIDLIFRVQNNMRVANINATGCSIGHATKSL